MKIDFDKELKICEEHKEKGFCYWGVCKYCGAPLLLKKLNTDEIEHNEEKKKMFEVVANKV